MAYGARLGSVGSSPRGRTPILRHHPEPVEFRVFLCLQEKSARGLVVSWRDPCLVRGLDPRPSMISRPERCQDSPVAETGRRRPDRCSSNPGARGVDEASDARAPTGVMRRTPCPGLDRALLRPEALRTSANGGVVDVGVGRRADDARRSSPPSALRPGCGLTRVTFHAERLRHLFCVREAGIDGGDQETDEAVATLGRRIVPARPGSSRWSSAGRGSSEPTPEW